MGVRNIIDSINFRLNKSGNEVILLTILQFRRIIDIHFELGSTGGNVSPLNARGNKRVVFVRTDFVSSVIASKDKVFCVNSPIPSLLLFRLGCCCMNFRIFLSISIRDSEFLDVFERFEQLSFD